MKIKSKNEIVFNVVVKIILFILVLFAIVPFWLCVVGSFNEGMDYARGNVFLFPRKFTLQNYKAVISDDMLIRAMIISVTRTVIGTFLCVIITSTVAYGMSNKKLKGKRIYAIMMLLTMYFYGGMIPTYILYKKLNLINNFLVYIIPIVFNVFYMIIIQASFREIPVSIAESARIDGASEYCILNRLYLPMSKPVIAAISLFVAVGHWNSYFDSMMYTTSNSLQTLQLYLQRIITRATFASNVADRAQQVIPQERRVITPQVITYATMIVSTLPILCVYPFVQKYFVKGMMIGSIKG